MAEIHQFDVTTTWNGDSDGSGVVRFPDGAFMTYGLPPGTGGKPGRSNPEELMTAAAASCYAITLSIQFENLKEELHLVMEASGFMERMPDRKLKFNRIILRPRITLAPGSKLTIEKAKQLAHLAEERCLISHATQGNVTITVEPVVTGAVAVTT